MTVFGLLRQCLPFAWVVLVLAAGCGKDDAGVNPGSNSASRETPASRRITDLLGRVTNAITGQPIAGAIVVLRGSGLQAVTDAEGQYQLCNSDRPQDANYKVPLPPGPPTLEIVAAGYDSCRVPDAGAGVVLGRCDVALRPGGKTNAVRVAPGGSFFQMEDGTPLPVTSFHHQIVGPPFCYDWNPTRGPKYWQYQPGKGAEFAALLRQQGVTVIRIYLEEAYILEWGNRIGMFQDPIGAYNPEVVAFWDRLFDWADEFGLKLLVGMYHSDQVVRNWPRHPYSANCGGPGPRDKANAMWYTDSCIRECQKRDLRFVIDRWGRRDSLFAIDLMPEANLHWGAGPQLVAAWCKDMAPYARQYARSRWGKAPLLTMSSGGDIPSQWQQGLFVDNPDLDFVATHVYDGKVGDPVVAGGKAVDCITPALEVNRHVRRMLAFMKTRKPYLVTETGPIRADVPLDKHCVINGVQSPLADEEYFHNVIWAHFASGASGSPTRWAFRPDTPEGYVLTRVMFGYLGVLRRVQLALDLPLFAPANIDNLLRLTAAQPRGAVSPPQDVDGVYLMGAADRDQGVVWVLQNQVPVPGAEPPLIEGSVLAVMDRSGGDYAVQFWDTRRGTVVGETNVSVPALSFIRVSVPAFRHDVAVVFKKLKPAAAANAK